MVQSLYVDEDSGYIRVLLSWHSLNREIQISAFNRISRCSRYKVCFFLKKKTLKYITQDSNPHLFISSKTQQICIECLLCACLCAVRGYIGEEVAAEVTEVDTTA